jgi:hypothetical protein
MTPSGIEPVTFRFVAQYLNHCATISGPHMYIYIYIYIHTHIYICTKCMSFNCFIDLWHKFNFFREVLNKSDFKTFKPYMQKYNLQLY